MDTKPGKLRVALTLLPALFLAACATTPTPLAVSRVTPAERVFYRDDCVGDRCAIITFIRDSGGYGSGVYQHLTIDDEHAASIDVAERVTFKLQPGAYIFSVKPTDLFGGRERYVLDLKLEPGRHDYYRIVMETSHTRLQRIPASKLN